MLTIKEVRRETYINDGQYKYNDTETLYFFPLKQCSYVVERESGTIEYPQCTVWRKGGGLIRSLKICYHKPKFGKGEEGSIVKSALDNCGNVIWDSLNVTDSTMHLAITYKSKLRIFPIQKFQEMLQYLLECIKESWGILDEGRKK
jgi:hypothetical protein